MSDIVTWPYPLIAGHSDEPEKGACALAAISWLVHGVHSDMPDCVCRVLSPYVIELNDATPRDVRQRLLNYLPRLSGSRSLAHEYARMRVLVLGAVRVIVAGEIERMGKTATSRAQSIRQIADDTPLVRIGNALLCAEKSGRYRGSAETILYFASRAVASAINAETAMAFAKSPAHNREFWSAHFINYKGAASKAAALCAVSRGRVRDGGWDECFSILDAALNAGPQGEAWSADRVYSSAQCHPIATTMADV